MIKLGLTTKNVKWVSPRYYFNIRQSLKRGAHMLTPEKDISIINNKFYLVFHKGSPIAGFYHNESGELGGLFSLVKGIGNELVQLRLKVALSDIHKECTSLTIECYGPYLRDLYMANGYNILHTYIWSDCLAPDGWDYEANGRPNIYLMEYKRPILHKLLDNIDKGLDYINDKVFKY